MTNNAITLTRLGSFDWGVYGKLTLGDFECYTVERPRLDNAPSVSCIPIGEYGVARGYYNAGAYDCVDILDVPGRSLIKIHVANVPSELAGCVALGSKPGWYKGQWAMLNSGTAFAEFMREFDKVGPNKIIITGP